MNIESLKFSIPAGTPIECVLMKDADPVPPGTKGIVTGVDDMGTIHVNWENGRTLGLIHGEDEYKFVK